LNKTSKMFPFITCTWNPIGGPCPSNCCYCWAKALIEKHQMKKYLKAEPYFDEKAKLKAKDGDFVFVQDMSDLFAHTVPTMAQFRVMQIIMNHPKIKFLLLTKHVYPYHGFLNLRAIPENVVLGVTVETNQMIFQTPSHYQSYQQISRAPLPTNRLYWLSFLSQFRHDLFISIEPILDFNLETFVYYLKAIKPKMVCVGYDNYDNKLPEPMLNKTEQLINELSKFTEVVKKTIRKAWYE